MQEDNTHNIILEHLRHLRGELAEIKGTMRDLRDGQNSMRAQLISMQGDSLRQERTVAGLQDDVGRINTRLNLTDA